MSWLDREDEESTEPAPKRDTEEDANKRHRLLKENLTSPEMRVLNMLLRKAEGQKPATTSEPILNEFHNLCGIRFTKSF